MNDEVKLYSSGILVSAATVIANATLVSGGNNSMYVSSGGTANSTTIHSGASMEIQQNGSANNTVILESGDMSCTGIASNTKITGLHGKLTVLSGGVAYDTVMEDYNCNMTVSSGGVADTVAVKSYPGLLIDSGAVGRNLTVNGFCYLHVHNGHVENVEINGMGGMYIIDNGTAENVTVKDNGYADIRSGCSIHSAALNSGILYLREHASAKDTTVNSGGVMNVENSAQAVQIVICSGIANISSGALASGGTASLGGAYCNLGGVMNVNGAVFSANSATSSGGAVYNNATMIQSGGTYTSNYADCAGALWNYSNGVFSGYDLEFSHNSATRYGGAICNNASGAQMVLSGGTFFSNYAGLDGGALHNCASTTMSLNDVVFSGNYAQKGGAYTAGDYVTVQWAGVQFLYNSAGNTGAFYTDRHSVENMSNVTFIGNSANENGAIALVDATISGTDVYFRNNSAVISHGGALNNNGGGSVYLAEAEFTSNYAKTSGGAIVNLNGSVNIESQTVFSGNSAERGGAIYNSGKLTVSQTQFNSNYASVDGGAVFNTNSTGSATLTACTFTGNHAAAGGGATFNTEKASVIVSGGSFAQNSATHGGAAANYGNMQIVSAGFTGNTANGWGGGALYNRGEGILQISGGSFTSNSATEGGAIQTYGAQTTIGNVIFANNSAYGTGMGYGGAYFNHNGTLEISSTLFTANSATQRGGGLYNYGKLTAQEISFDNNSALYGGAFFMEKGSAALSGGIFTSNTAVVNGGAMYNTSAAVTTMDNANFTGNLATSSGGALYNNATIIQSGGTYTSNHADCGGAIWNYSSGVFSGYDLVFSGNSANAWGGAICNNASGTQMFLSGGSFVSNYAGVGGGAFHNAAYDSAFLTDMTFIGNSAGNFGGAIYNIDFGQITVKNTTIQDSFSPWQGAVYNCRGTATFENVSFLHNSANENGGIANTYDGTCSATGVTFEGNKALTGHGGAICDNGSSFYLKNVTFTGNEAKTSGGAIIHQNGNMQIDSAVFSGNKAESGGAIYNCSGTVLSITDTKFLTASDTIVNKGTMSFSGSVSLAGNLYTDTTITATNANIIFDISSYSEANTTRIISDLGKISGVSDWTISVNTEQTTGTYILANGADGFSQTITIKDTNNTELGTISVGGTLKSEAVTYSLALDGSVLKLTVSDKPADLAGDSSGIWWSGSADSYVAEYTTDDFAHGLRIATSQTAVDTYGMDGSYDWRVRNNDSEKWAQGEEISAVHAETPQELVSDADGVGDVFFVTASGVWGGRYHAQHLGVDSWSGTKELVALAEKNQITDIFSGSTDANILVLTDDGNGDALFVDDIYSAFPTEQKARLAQINEIRAGAGDDVVDLTSQRFSYTNGVTLRGGDGDDTLWANRGENKLFGDSGNDRLVGCFNDDLLVGGIGNDSMNGGGGNDIFCFCKGWGKDTVEQLEGGSVTLWFVSGSDDNWDSETMTYTAGANSVTVSGVSTVTLKFGDDGSAQYDELVAAGVFMEASSFNIFEEENKGLVVSLHC